MSSKMENGSEVKQAELNLEGSSRIRQLESRYIQLLEKRVADLEAVINNDKKPEAKQSGQDLTTNERVEKYLANGDKNGPGQRRDSIGSCVAQSVKPSKITFRDIKYNDEGVETPIDVSDKEAAKPGGPVQSKDSVDLIWTRRFDTKNLYTGSEVQIISKELRDLFRLEFAHDPSPQLHFGLDSSKDEIMLESPFEPLLHNWKRLHTLVTNDCDGEEWQALKPKMAKLRTDTVSAVPGNEDDVIIKAKEDLVVLLNQVQSAPGMDPFLETIKNFGSNRTIQFKHLWTIFPPGELVISNLFMDAPQAFIVQECSSEIHDESDAGTQKEKQVWMLWCWSYDWNGKTFDRVLVYFKFEEYPGARMINTLHCHPLQYHFVDDASDAKIVQLKEDMIERGKLYRDYAVRDVGAQMFDYTGSAISHGSGFQRLKNGQNQSDRDNFIEFMFGRRRGRPPPSKSGEVRQITGRVMVDFDSYIQHAPNVGQRPPMGKAMYSARSEECRCGACTNNQLLIANQRRNFDDFTADKPFADDEQYLLCPPRVLGYHLGTRTWLELNVNTIKSISQPASNRAFTKLQLLERDKDLIQALVQSHTSGTGKEPMMEDIVSGKGKGLVILLHGPPGVGKTLTAESVAEMAGKPLFAVSPSDIGLEPADVEHNLESLFELAARWRAVLLFDEADVFLESRSAHTSDLTRNALVSVLLRVLEYYSGILILTTNRITQFDIAVQSRVNLGIRYTDLSIEQKQKIFEQFLADVKEDLVEERQEILKWFKKDPDAIEWFDTMNGRQVRNVLFSAASLALKDGQCLKLRHIKTMARSTAKFQDSLRSIVLTARSKNEVGRINE